jgi:hypothetical protein
MNNLLPRSSNEGILPHVFPDGARVESRETEGAVVFVESYLCSGHVPVFYWP